MPVRSCLWVLLCSVLCVCFWPNLINPNVHQNADRFLRTRHGLICFVLSYYIVSCWWVSFPRSYTLLSLQPVDTTFKTRDSLLSECADCKAKKSHCLSALTVISYAQKQKSVYRSQKSFKMRKSYWSLKVFITNNVSKIHFS